MIKRKLSQIAKLVNGYAFKSEKYADSGIRIIRIANVQDGYISDEFPCFYPMDSLSYLGDSLLNENDLLMSLTGNVGRVAILKKELLPAALNQRVECIRPNNGISKEYLYHFFKSEKFKIEAIKNSTGCAQLNMSTNWLGNYEIPIYDQKTTQEISKCLNEIEKAIEIAKNQLLLLDELIKSRFIEMFGDPLLNEKGFVTEPLSKACLFNEYKGSIDSVDGKFWILNLDKIEPNTGKVLEKVYQSLDEIGDSTISFDENCVLYSKLRPYLNKVVIPDSTGYGTSELISMRTNEKINKYFLASLLKSDSFVAYINSKTAGSKMPRASMDVLRSFNLIMPPIQIQNEFASFVEQIDKSKFIVHSRYFLCDILTLFSSTIA